ncbi:hypothetical protein G6F55_014505 [Rhizopus delemar]|nr:hypothetical protein G6F68_020021 [Rhizopus microsporus]KAG1434630.1 hypothetical protein G6F55_014505 [Rhizopus delemar]
MAAHWRSGVVGRGGISAHPRTQEESADHWFWAKRVARMDRDTSGEPVCDRPGRRAGRGPVGAWGGDLAAGRCGG